MHSGNGNKNAYKTLIAAEYTGVEVELVPDFGMGVSNKTPEFLKMNPIGKLYFYDAVFIVICTSSLLEVPVTKFYVLLRFLCWKHLMVLSLRAMQ